MTLLLAALSIFAGLALLTVGGDKLVEGSVTLARRWGLSEVFIGVALVGFGTSMPEIMATLAAARQGQDALALGNIIGSNIANVGLILGAGFLLVQNPNIRKFTKERLDYTLMLGGVGLFSFYLLTMGLITPWAGVSLLVFLATGLTLSYRAMTKNRTTAAVEEEDIHPPKSLKAAFLAIAIGFAGLMVGAELLVGGAITIARALGVPEGIIGLSLVAIGTSLPELAAAIAAARHGRIGLILGNVLGSNGFNALAVAGIGALAMPLRLGDMTNDIGLMLLFCLAPLPLFFVAKPPLRFLGSLLLGGYALYITMLALQ